jgi:ketosteroid isomerase-like protein
VARDNVEIVLRASDLFNAGDIEGFLELCAPDLEYRDLPELPGSGVFIGHDAMRGWWAQVYDAFEDVHFEADDIIDAGACVLVVTHGRGRGKSSGAPVEMHFTNVWTLRDGTVVSIVSHADHDEALEAAGLRD